MALAKEEDAASKERLEKLRAELADQKEKLAELTTRWQNEKSAIDVVRELKEQLEQLRGEADRAERDGNLEKTAELRYGRIPEVEKKLDAALPQAEAREDVMLKEEVGPDDIADVVSAWTGIPAGRMLEGETAKLLRMEDELGKRVVGQKKAVQAVSDAVRRSRAGVADPNRPTGSFMFLGPTGVGKTELAKALAEFLFDEIEKAHPDVFDVLLAVLDEGRLTDGQGRTVDFRNTILILTSNLGSGGTEEQVMAAVRSAFKPEFINRLDDVIIFDGLNPEELVQIVDIQLEQLAKRLAQRRLTLEVSLPAKRWLAQRGFDPQYGARPLRRLIQQAIGDQLAKMLLAGDVHDGDVVPVNVSPDGDHLVLG
jgi:ATP-dependent Clp protease ATP-binding subunit ClpB